MTRPSPREKTEKIKTRVPSSRSLTPPLHPPRSDAKVQRIGETESDVAEAEALIRRMDLEARSQQNPAQKNPMLNKLRDYKSELARLKRESQLASRAANEANNRSQLLAGAELDDVGAPTSSSQRDRMMHATQTLDRTGDR